jgi:Tfp pilus assembly protein PilN
VTVLSSETRLIGTGSALLPRVNLLPPEIGERRQFRRIQAGLGSAVVASVAVVGLLVVSASHGVSSAKSDLASAQSQNVSLQAEAAKYRNVTAVYAAAAAAQAQLSQAMGDEVRYSQLLNDLSLSIPSNVWLKNLAFAQGGAPGAPAAAAGATPSVGTLTVSGVAYSHDDVALWLESIAGLKTYESPYFSNSTEALLGTKPVVNFSGTASLTGAALSKRYLKSVGN